MFTSLGDSNCNSIFSGKKINDGNWHWVELKTATGTCVSGTCVSVDGTLDVSSSSTVFAHQWNTSIANSGLSVGKAVKPYMAALFNSTAYKGCIEKLVIGQQLLQFKDSANKSIIAGCHSDNPCTSSTCLRGTCSDAFDSFQCTCPPHYTGKLCNTTSNLTCAASPCSAHSLCVNVTKPTVRVLSQSGLDKFKCNCLMGYTGYLCENPKNDCAPNPCIHGNCTDLPGGYRCTCQSGYTGHNCSVNIDDCSPGPCKNGGACVDHVSNYTCNCPSNFTGRNCASDMNECLKTPCRNNATCLNYMGGYNCTCRNGSFGVYCEYDASTTCQSNPCMNNGTCTVGNAGYKCRCQDGFNGMQCQVSTNPCVSNPCNNSGTCDRRSGPCPASEPNCANFTCTCSGNWMGRNCNLIKPCSLSPCKNGGVCSTPSNIIRSSPNYACQCTSGFQGDQCQTRKTTKSDVNIGLWIGVVAAVLVVLLLVLLVCRFCKRQGGNHGDYRPSSQEKGQIQMAPLPRLPPKERLI